MPKSTTSTPGGSLLAAKSLDDLDAKGIIAQKDVSDAGNEDPRSVHVLAPESVERCKFFGLEEETMARLTSPAQVLARVVVQRHGHVELVFVVLFDRFDGGGLAAQGQIEDVAAQPRPQSHPVARPQFDVVDDECSRLPAAGQTGPSRCARIGMPPVRP